MKKSSIYKHYKSEIIDRNVHTTTNYWFIFKDNKILINSFCTGVKIIPQIDINSLTDTISNKIFLGSYFDIPCYCCEVTDEIHNCKDLEFVNIRSLFTLVSEDLFMLTGKAFQLMTWMKNNKFCGRCGNLTEKSTTENALKCTNCSNKIYTKISPAIITAIIKDNKILLANAAKNSTNGIYSLIAGFLEPGEDLEECVKREVYEEVGINVKNIKYFSSQPWPFPDSLMVGFICEYKSCKIKVDGEEIVKADWFTPNNIPNIPSKISIARKIIDWYILKYPNIL